jgi:NAD(P)-dependent dehydrogenase (short-subunit alcohol dehydrogenase family)
VSKTIVVIGLGPGISTAVAEKFGAAGFSVALVGRNPERLASGIESLKVKDIAAAAFPADAGDPAAIRNAIAKARAQFGPITVIHWNAFGGREAGDLATAGTPAVRGIFDVAIVGLLAAVQESLPDLKSTNGHTGEGAILVTNGAFGEMSAQMDEYAVSLNAMGVALANAAKDKLVGLLAQRLKGDGIYVGQVMIAGTIKGTPWSNADSIEPSAVAEKFWDLYQARGEVRARVS